MKHDKKLIHPQVLLAKHPDSTALGLDLDQILAHWRAGLLEGEIREPMHTLFITEQSFLDLMAYLKECEMSG